MIARIGLVFCLLALAAEAGFGQATAPAWRPVGETAGQTGSAAAPAHAPTPAARDPETVAGADALAGVAAGRSGARVSGGTGTLPNEHGQIWREYDISPYTLRVTTTERPEQALVDWILRETGYEAWHSEPLGILSATPRTLRVYHTPAMQAVVAELVDRFVRSEAETMSFALRVITVENPGWRARLHRMLRPVTVQTPGVGAWLLEREDAALVLAELQRRSDYREHSSPHLLVNNGQSTVVSGKRNRPYVRDVLSRPDVWPGYEAELGQVEEGFALEFSPLLSLDGQMIDAALRCDVDQIEKMIPVAIDVPTPAAPRQRTQIEVPQITQFRLHERFRWPTSQVLLVSMGMVPLPVPVDGKPIVPILPIPLGNSPPRADLLVLIECRGQVGNAGRTSNLPDARSYRGRY
jgi:hypothetical protein